MSAARWGGQTAEPDSKVTDSPAAPDPARMVLRMHSLCGRDDPAAPALSLDAAERAALAAIAEVVTIEAPGGVVYLEGERADAAYLVVEGLVRLSRRDGDGLRHVLALLWPGDVTALAEEGSYVDTACALTRTILYRFDLAALRDLLLAYPALQLRLLLKTVHDLRLAEQRIVMLSQESAQRRIAVFLADLCGLDAVYDAATGEIRLPLNRTDIADYLGLAVETVSRGIRDIEEAGLLERRSPRLFRITNHKELVRLAQAVL